MGKDVLRQRAQDLFVQPAASRAGATRNLGVKLFQGCEACGSRATIQQRAQDLLAPRALATRRAGPRKRQRATIQQKVRELLPAAKNLDTLIWGQGLRLSPYRAAALGLKPRWSLPTSAALFSTYCRRPSAMRVSIRLSGASMSPRNPTPGNCYSYG